MDWVLNAYDYFSTYQPDQPKPTNTENFHFYSILLSLADKNNAAKNEATEDLRQRRVLKERRTNKTYFHVCKCRGKNGQTDRNPLIVTSFDERWERRSNEQEGAMRREPQDGAMSNEKVETAHPE